MRSMFVAEFAELLQLDAIGVRPFVLARRIVPLLAVRASQSDNHPHPFHLPGLHLHKKTTIRRKLRLGEPRPSRIRGRDGMPHDNDSWCFADDSDLRTRSHRKVTKIIYHRANSMSTKTARATAGENNGRRFAQAAETPVRCRNPRAPASEPSTILPLFRRV